MTDHQKEILKRIPKATPVVGVEVGVWRGETSFALLRNRHMLHLHMIDPWKSGEPGTVWYESGSTMPSRPQADYELAMRKALARVAYFEAEDRFTVHRDESLNVVNNFEDGSLDFVFLDGDHSYQTVVNEIIAWMPKVKKGGWIGGHDYGTSRNGKVAEAVNATIPHPDKVEVGTGHTWFYYV